ncbi:MAG: hypothetical protein ACRD2Z_02305 [Thermoanaerobaculia bacterium]
MAWVEGTQGSVGGVTAQSEPEPTPQPPSTTPAPQEPDPGSGSARETAQAQAVRHSFEERQRALGILDRDFLIFDTAGGRPQDGLVSREGLSAVADGSGYTAEQREAARVLLEDAALFEQLDIGWSGAVDDGLVGQQAVENFLQAESAPTGDEAVTLVVDDFDAVDTAAQRRDGDTDAETDNRVSQEDLRATAEDPNADPRLRAAAQYLLDNPTLLQLVDTGNDGRGPWAADDRITRQDLAAFLETNAHLRNLVGYEDRLDTAAKGGDPDGYVSSGDLAAAADDTALPQEVRDAARYLLEHDAARNSVLYPRGPYSGGFDFQHLLAARLINGQAYAHDPAAAAEFVNQLPVADNGEEGMPITLTSDDGFKALANAALRHAAGDLTETQSIIAHLPETESALRNEMITAYYDLLAQRADAIFAGAAGAAPGDPTSAGHPGVNWLMFAPWASNGVHDVITGDFTVFGLIHPSMGARQGAADGNQWIFNDITSRFAAFVELYESNGGSPSTEQLETFFQDNFGDGDLQIRTGFQAYVAALNEPDPARRQQLMFQANTLVAIHEQAGADPYLSKVATGPDTLATEFIDVQMGRFKIEVNHDLDPMANDANLVDEAPILSLDPILLGDSDLSGNGVTFRTGSTSTTGVVDLPAISGWEGDFELSTQEWWRQEGQGTEYIYTGPYSPPAALPVEIDPDVSFDGSGADSWPDYEDRMWTIHRLFEQLHTERSLYETDPMIGNLELNWLDDSIQGAVVR